MVVTQADEIASFVDPEWIDGELQLCGFIDLLLLVVRIEVRRTDAYHCGQGGKWV